ncbi:MAG: hypothetical protein LBJ11_03805 [Oscillospiraceae bacterium]|jgi:uncharacterized repeat protein (TIGR04076 family)|nr:hypothetical protein [Oscillospiraceae bacterium]
MKKWVTEDWEFELTVIDGQAGHCRLGIEKGDKFIFQYECPVGICSKLMARQLYALCEVIRYGGDFTYSRSQLRRLRRSDGAAIRFGSDFTYRASKGKYELDLPCPDGRIQFHLKAYPINRDETGKPKPNNPRPEN